MKANLPTALCQKFKPANINQMKATQQLKDEHERIKLMLKIMESMKNAINYYMFKNL
jgi:hypothetical protein